MSNYLLLGLLVYVLMDVVYILKNGKVAYVDKMNAHMSEIDISTNGKPLFYCVLIVVTSLFVVFWVPIVLYKLSKLIVEGSI